MYKRNDREPTDRFEITMAVLRVVFLVVLCLCLAEAQKRYDGFKVLRVMPNDQMDLDFLRSLQRTFPGDLDFWTEPSQPGHSVDVMVSPAELSLLRDTLEEHGLEFSTMMEDVQRKIDQIPRRQPGGISPLAKFRYDWFHTQVEIDQWMDDMAAQHSPIMSLDKLPNPSYEGRDIRFFKIGKPGVNKPIFWWQSGTHPREWLASATTIKIIYLLVTDYESGNKPEVVQLLDSVDFYIMPIFNPDGYSHTWEQNRLWRKSMAPTRQSWCTGTDLNRNFNDHWSESGTSVNPCSDIYHGDGPESEIEVQSLIAYLPTLTNMKVYIDMHAYSQFWMTPFGFTAQNFPANYDDQLALADKAMAALTAVNGKHFKTGSIANVIYAASGSTIDWVYNNLATTYCYAPELRDEGGYGFIAPESEIHPSAMEVYAAIKVIGNEIKP